MLRNYFVNPFFRHQSFTRKLQPLSRLLSTELPKEAECVVIGGGSMGCSTFYHLTKLGVKNTLLLEQHKLTAGSTWHTAGLLWNLRPNDVEIPLVIYTRKLISEILPVETGQDAGWINNGGLFIATTKERMDEYRRLHTIGKSFGIESELLTPKETKTLYPLMNVDDLYGSLHSPLDGLMDPTSWCAALTKAGTKRGGRVFENTQVKNITTTDAGHGRRKVTGVETMHGHIKTSKVVNCAGAWGPKLCAKLGLPSPTAAHHHQYVITEKIEGVRNMPNVRDHDGSFYLRLYGDALALGGYQYNPPICGNHGEVPDDFAFGLYNIDWDGYQDIMEHCCKRIPALRNVGMKSEISGPMSSTPDGEALAGEAPDLKGYFYGHGFDRAINLGGGGGRALASWIINGRPDEHLFSWDIRRFNPKISHNQRWILERTHEHYTSIYKIRFPKDEHLSSRNMIKSPFYDQLKKQGCFFQERHGWERPGWFDPRKKEAVPRPYDYYGAYGHERHRDDLYDKRLRYDYTFDIPEHFHIIEDEALACRNNVVGFDMSYVGKFYLTGPDAQRAADYIFTNDVHQPPGNTVYTCMLNDGGGIEGDLTVSCVKSGAGSPCDPRFEGKGFYLVVGGASAYHSFVHIRDVIHDQGFNVSLDNRTEEMGAFSIQGPNSRKLLQNLTPDVDFSESSMPFSSNRLVSINGITCRLLRISFVGELGYELYIPTEHCESFYRSIQEAGQELGFKNAGYEAMESLSAEKGYRLWNGDMRMTHTPLEAGLKFTTKLNTPLDFLGRRGLETQLLNGIKKRIVCVTIKEKKMLHGLETIYRDGVVVGNTTRGSYAFSLGHPIAYGTVSRPDNLVIGKKWLNSGTYELECLGEKFPAMVTFHSTFDPEHTRIRGIYPQ